jgi:hypothetical protein
VSGSPPASGLSYRDVEELMAERGVILTHEAVRYWRPKFGQAYANQLRHRRPRPGDTRHLDEMLLTINKEHHDLWRAVDQEGHVLDILVQRRRDKKEEEKFFRELLTYVPRVIITGKLRSCGATDSQLPRTVRGCSNASKLGGGSQTQPWPHKGRAQDPSLPCRLVITSRRIHLTMPQHRYLNDRKDFTTGRNLRAYRPQHKEPDRRSHPPACQGHVNRQQVDNTSPSCRETAIF